ncbi:MAG: deoxynucleoside kinase [Propionibacterium sp.]|nr:deoxynucleoside kinase [Propionibacterium sp.]
MLITLAGPIGSGKTVLTQILAQELNAEPLFEPVDDNPVIDDFYRGNALAEQRRAAGEADAHNPFAFVLQIYLLNRRFAQIKWARTSGRNCILDRSIYEDRVFMRMNFERGNVTVVEWETYESLFHNMMEELEGMPYRKAPDLMVLIKVSYPTMMRHIVKRGRPFEQLDADPELEDYYRDLLRHYDLWQREYDASPLLVIDGDRLDFEGNAQDRAAVLDAVRSRL